MPSYRAVQEIADVRPGRRPDEVLAAAVGACEASGHRVEARDLEVIAGRARIWVRFSVPDAAEAEEDLEASEVARAVETAVRRVALAGQAQAHRRSGGRWTRAGGPAVSG